MAPGCGAGGTRVTTAIEAVDVVVGYDSRPVADVGSFRSRAGGRSVRAFRAVSRRTPGERGAVGGATVTVADMSTALDRAYEVKAETV